MQRNLKLQPAIDYLSSYGIAIITILVALSVLFVIGFTNNVTTGCTSPPGFICNYVSINASSALTFKFSQALGDQIKINGIACSSSQNFNNDYPEYGNTAVNAIPAYYTPLQYPPGNVVASGSSYIASMYCYDSAGKATGTIGRSFTGFVWLNYSLPNYNSQVQEIASFTSYYSNSSLVLR